MKVIVTGGAGFIGSHLVDRLVDDDNQVIIIDNLSTGLLQNLNPRAICIRVDINNPVIETLFSAYQPEVVFHLAAQINIAQSMQYPLIDMNNNIAGSINIFENCARCGARKVIYASSAAVYGEPEYLGLDEQHPVNPTSCYGVSKHVPEHYLSVFAKLGGFKYSILRYANVYGPRQQPGSEAGAVAIFTNQLRTGQFPTIYGDGEQTRDFVYVDDVVEATLRAASEADNEIFNIGTGAGTSVNNLFITTRELIGASVQPDYLDARLGDILHSYMNVSKARSRLGWQAKYTLADGLKAYITSLDK